MEDTKSSETKEPTVLLTIILILSGLVLILIAQLPNMGELEHRILESLGVVLASVFSISLVYERRLAEKYLIQFGRETHHQLRNLESIGSKCLKTGIREIFEDRTDFQKAYPLVDRINEANADSDVLVIARSLFHFSTNRQAIQKGLEKGLHFKLLCVDPSSIDDAMSSLGYLNPDEVKSALRELLKVVTWAQAERRKPPGSLELRYIKFLLFDTAFRFERPEDIILVWDLSFGKNLADKRIIVLELPKSRPSPTGLAASLGDRYTMIWNEGKTKLMLRAGVVEMNEVKLGVSVN